MIGLSLRDLPFLGKIVVPPAEVLAEDDFESYTAGNELGGLNGGTNWSAAYLSRSAPVPADDDFESYTPTADLDGLNGGTTWNGAYVSR